MELAVICVLWAGFVGATVTLARIKRRSAWRWWLCGMLAGPAALLAVMMLPMPPIICCPTCGSEFRELWPR